MSVKAISFIARSGTGKTTLLERILPELLRRGLRVGALKHDAHRFDIDHPGKDSHRFTAAGAAATLIVSDDKMAFVKNHPEAPSVEELIRTYFSDMDIVLVEGFSRSSLPKIELHRKEKGDPLLCRGEHHDPGLVAAASDEPLDLDVPVLNLNDPRSIADFIEGNLLRGSGCRDPWRQRSGPGSI